MLTSPLKHSGQCRYCSMRHMSVGKQQGFSLIEFLVASAISMIILIAAGTTYFMTRQLNQVSGERLVAQQDLRNAATLIIRDARQAGTFGCANLADMGEVTQVAVSSGYPLTDPLGLRTQVSDNEPNGFGLRIMPGSAFIAANAANIADFTPQGDVLIFVYGDGYASVSAFIPNAPNPTVNATALRIAADANGALSHALAATAGTAPIVVSSCSRMHVLRRGTDYTTATANEIRLNSAISVTNAQYIPDAFLAGQLSVSKLMGSAYVVGRMSNAATNGLYRFQLAADGTWGTPQLLISNIADTDGMGIQLGYVKTDECVNGASSPNETFTFHNTTTTIPDHSKLPAIVRITLKVKADNTRDSAIDVGNISDYVIDAAVRNGNVCANRGIGA